MQRSYKQLTTKITNRLLYILPGCAAIVVAAIVAMGIGHDANNNTSAVPAPYGTSTAFSVLSELSLGVTIDDSAALSITPTANGKFEQGDIDLTVNTSNYFGYTLDMYAYSPLDSTTATTSLTNTTPLSSGGYATISTLASGSYTAATFQSDTTDATKNKWAYSADGTNFIPVQSHIALNDGTDCNPSTTVCSGSFDEKVIFGAKIDNSIPNGLYSVVLNFVVTAKAPSPSYTASSFDRAFAYAGVDTYNNTGYYAMQDMTDTICGYVYKPTTASDTNVQSLQLIDKRDNKVYWVSKLMDGNCWMTQNLDLNLGSVTLNSDTSDIAATTAASTTTGYTVSNGVATWTPERSTIDSTGYGSITTCTTQNSTGTGCQGQTNTGFASGWTNDNDKPYSADPGFRYVVPKTMSAANTNWWDNGDTYYNCASQDTLCGGNSANGHYTMGNFYNFAAATATNSVAGTIGHDITNADANTQMPNSICPKNWRLVKDNSDASKNEFNILLGASNYNVTSSFNYTGLNAIRSNPLYFVRSGFVNGGTLYNAGVASYVWSGTISAASNGYYLYFNSTGINPADNNNRLYGFPVRCVAR